MRHAILVLALVAGLTDVGPAQASTLPIEQSCNIHDSRVPESSGLAVSRLYPDLAYTLNDGGKHPVVYAVRLSSCTVVGVSSVQADIPDMDTEAISVASNGTVWVGDLGDNNKSRHDTSLISFAEPGMRTGTITNFKRDFIRYPNDKPVDVETLMLRPSDGQVFLVSKTTGKTKGAVYSLPAVLAPNKYNDATKTSQSVKSGISDGTFTPDGHDVMLRRKNDTIYIYRTTTWPWTSEGHEDTPDLAQPESISVSLETSEPGRVHVYVGSEGTPSPIQKLRLKIP